MHLGDETDPGHRCQFRAEADLYFENGKIISTDYNDPAGYLYAIARNVTSPNAYSWKVEKTKDHFIDHVHLKEPIY